MNKYIYFSIIFIISLICGLFIPLTDNWWIIFKVSGKILTYIMPLVIIIEIISDCLHKQIKKQIYEKK